MKKTPAPQRLFRDWISPTLQTGLLDPFFSTFPKAELYVVGGAVRDALLGRTGKKDLDLLVRGVDGTRLESFLRNLGHVSYVGKRFGVWKFTPKGTKETVDIALPRTEVPKNTGGYKDVVVKSNASLALEKDLARRDFTINAMAWSLKDGRLVDPFHGMHDLSRRVLRAVGSPADRFKEDYTRILRGLRFAVELDATVAPTTWAAMKKFAKQLVAEKNGVPIVAREMVAKEFLTSLAVHPAATIRLWDKAGVLDVLMPEAMAMKGCTQPKNFHSEGDVWKHALLAVEQLETKKFATAYPSGWNAETALAVFLHDVAKPATKKKMRGKRGSGMTFYGHDVKGGEMAIEIIDRLALTSWKAPRIDIDRERVAYAVKHHLLAIHGDPALMQATTLEKHFFNNLPAADLLLKVMYCDGSATITSKGSPALQAYRTLLKRLDTLRAQTSGKVKLPPPFVDGIAIMKLLNITPGPKVGEAIHALREAQLTGKVTNASQAKSWLKAHYG